MSVLDSARGAINAGLELGVGRKASFKGIGSIAGLGIAGASIGAGLSSLGSDGTVDPVTGAAIGGAIGASALPLAGFAVGAIGSSAVGIAKRLPSIGMAIGSGAVKASPYVAATGVRVADEIGNKMWSVGSKLVNWDETADSLNKVRLSGPIAGVRNGWNAGREFKNMDKGILEGFKAAPIENTRALIGKSGKAVTGSIINGKTLLAGGAILEGLKGAWNALETANIGQNAGTVTPTPRVPNYANNASATGDLVFALNANRHG
jgi:hypothetical protein